MNIVKEIDWDNVVSSANNKWVERLLSNFQPVVIVDNTLYIKYIGEENKKKVVAEALKKHKPNFDQTIKNCLSVNNVVFNKQIDDISIKWLESLIEKFGTKKIEFNLFRNS